MEIFENIPSKVPKRRYDHDMARLKDLCAHIYAEIKNGKTPRKEYLEEISDISLQYCELKITSKSYKSLNKLLLLFKQLFDVHNKT